MPDGIVLTADEAVSNLSVGLLGASADREKFDLIGPAYFTAVRLEEIERRILAIEAQLNEGTRD